jgi:hypothetical protein
VSSSRGSESDCRIARDIIVVRDRVVVVVVVVVRAGVVVVVVAAIEVVVVVVAAAVVVVAVASASTWRTQRKNACHFREEIHLHEVLHRTYRTRGLDGGEELIH